MPDNTELATQDIPENAWFKSSFSGAGSGGDCVEVAHLDGGSAIRDTKDHKRGQLRLTSASMAAFVGSVKTGDLGPKA